MDPSHPIISKSEWSLCLRSIQSTTASYSPISSLLFLFSTVLSSSTIIGTTIIPSPHHSPETSEQSTRNLPLDTTQSLPKVTRTTSLSPPFTHKLFLYIIKKSLVYHHRCHSRGLQTWHPDGDNNRSTTTAINRPNAVPLSLTHSLPPSPIFFHPLVPFLQDRPYPIIQLAS